MARAAAVVVGELVSLVARSDAVPYGCCGNLLLETRAKEHFLAAGSNDEMRFKKFPTDLKNTKIENFYGSCFGVQLTCGKMFLGSRFQWKIFIAPVRDHTRSRYETNEFGIFSLVVGYWLQTSGAVSNMSVCPFLIIPRPSLGRFPVDKERRPLENSFNSAGGIQASALFGRLRRTFGALRRTSDQPPLTYDEGRRLPIFINVELYGCSRRSRMMATASCASAFRRTQCAFTQAVGASQMRQKIGTCRYLDFAHRLRVVAVGAWGRPCRSPRSTTSPRSA